jgi:hypothetical protein
MESTRAIQKHYKKQTTKTQDNTSTNQSNKGTYFNWRDTRSFLVSSGTKRTLVAHILFIVRSRESRRM